MDVTSEQSVEIKEILNEMRKVKSTLPEDEPLAQIIEEEEK